MNEKEKKRNYEKWATDILKKEWIEKIAIRIFVLLGLIASFAPLWIITTEESDSFIPNNLFAVTIFVLTEITTWLFWLMERMSTCMLAIEDHLIQKQARKMAIIHFLSLLGGTSLFFILYFLQLL